MIEKCSPEEIERNEREAAEWRDEIKRLQAMMAKEAAHNNLLSQEIPRLTKEIEESRVALGDANPAKDEALERLESLKKESRELEKLRQVAVGATKLIKDVERLKGDVKDLEESLMHTGSTKTADDVQKELDDLAAEMFVFVTPLGNFTFLLIVLVHSRIAERERTTIRTDRDHRSNALRTQENELHSLQLDESKLESQIRDRSMLEGQIESYRVALQNTNDRIKVGVVPCVFDAWVF